MTDARKLMFTRGVRGVADGLVSVALATYLTGLGFNAFEVGAITTGSWWYIVPPGVCVVLVVLAFTLVGQALEDVFNPRLRGR